VKRKLSSVGLPVRLYGSDASPWRVRLMRGEVKHFFIVQRFSRKKGKKGSALLEADPCG
jgi:hypothetical protein